MRPPTILITANIIGRIYHATGNTALAKTRPLYCFVPEAHFEENGLQQGRYLVSRWPSINCSANPYAVGSHVIPDPEKPADLRSRCPILAEFLQRLEHVAAVKTITAK
jgi:hypothetical protein